MTKELCTCIISFFVVFAFHVSFFFSRTVAVCKYYLFLLKYM